MAQSVQFRGIKKVVDAYNNRDVKAWSVWSGRQLLFSCAAANTNEAAAELETLLESLDTVGNGIYTLKIHDDLKKTDKITEKTAVHGSFNFRLKEYDEEQEGRRGFIYDQIKALQAENETLKAEIAGMDDDEDDEPKDFLGKITQTIAADPTQLPAIIASFKQVFDMFTGQTRPTGQPVAALAGINDDARLLHAIEALKKADPKLSEHLEKLAGIAVNDPGTFKMLLNMLENS